jgi:hypothetical protein
MDWYALKAGKKIKVILHAFGDHGVCRGSCSGHTRGHDGTTFFEDQGNLKRKRERNCTKRRSGRRRRLESNMLAGAGSGSSGGGFVVVVCVVVHQQ